MNDKTEESNAPVVLVIDDEGEKHLIFKPDLTAALRSIELRGKLGGQFIDVQSEGKDLSLDAVREMHRRKTGALIRVAVRSGAMLAGAALPLGWPSRLKRSRWPGTHPARHSRGRMERRPVNALSLMLAP